MLAPARDAECGKAAISHGADAVYIGAEKFGARASASNSVDDIGSLCRYARLFGAKVYATVNTIVYDHEIEEVRTMVERLADAGVDALLVQDMALPAICREVAASTGRHICLHASTQTDNRTPEKVKWLRAMGFRRVVLARELSLREIADIHRQVPDMEIEVFVHGALCVSYSGQCYASHYCFGRSANRGECAQMCRMRFDLVDATGHVIVHDSHLLSLKDLCLIDHLEELIMAGASSFKIEGRLKDANYVKNVTAAYSQRIDDIIARHPDEYCRASRGRCRYTFKPCVSKTFNRGFTTYFLNGRQPDITSPDTPKSMGEYVGKVKEIRDFSFTVSGISRFANGDGLCFVDDAHELVGFRVNKAVGNRLYPYRMPEGLRRGVPLYRNNDHAFANLLRRTSSTRRIPIEMAISATDRGYAIEARSAYVAATAEVEAEHQRAKTPQRDNIVRQLTKLGSTVYECEDVAIPADFDYFVPSSMLADLRREVTGRLAEAETKVSQGDITRHEEGRAGALVPDAYHARYPYLYNAANRLSRALYAAAGVDAGAFETAPPSAGVLMQCRYCIRYAMGYCTRHGGAAPSWHEPLRLRLYDGRALRLVFDCRNCQMNVVYDEDE